MLDAVVEGLMEKQVHGGDLQSALTYAAKMWNEDSALCEACSKQGLIPLLVRQRPSLQRLLMILQVSLLQFREEEGVLTAGTVHAI